MEKERYRVTTPRRVMYWSQGDPPIDFEPMETILEIRSVGMDDNELGKLPEEDTGECGVDHESVPVNKFGGYIICDNCGTNLGE